MKSLIDAANLFTVCVSENVCLNEYTQSGCLLEVPANDGLCVKPHSGVDKSEDCWTPIKYIYI